MANMVKITMGLYLLGMVTRQCTGGQTLYPITDANTAAPPPRAVEAGRNGTNQVPPKSEVALLLKPTAIGPIGGSGLVQFKGHTAFLHVSRLGSGSYQLQAARRHEDVPVLLGVVTIVDPTLGPSRQATDNKKEASANPDSVTIETDVQLKLPPGLDPRDIARVQVLGPGGNAVLSGEAK